MVSRFFISSDPKKCRKLYYEALKSLTMKQYLNDRHSIFVAHTAPPQSDIPTQAPVESSPDLKEQTNKFYDDIAALSQRFPQLTSLLNEKDSRDDSLILEISLKEIFTLCPRNRCRLDRYSKLQEYLNKNYNVTLIIKSQKTK